jgi:hypothetical protein
MKSLNAEFARLDTLIDQNLGTLGPMTPELEELLLTIGSAQHVAGLVNRELKRAADDPELFDPRWMGSEITLHTGKSYVLAVSLLDTHPRLPYTLTSDMALVAVGADSEIDIEHLALPEGVNLDVFDPSAVAVIARKERLAVGRTALLQAGQVVRFNAKRLSVLLTVTTKAVFEQAWYFDPVTLAPTSAHSASVGTAIIQTLSDFLASYGDEDALPVIKSLLAHPAHFVRYSAARDLLRLSFNEGLDAFKTLSADPHPHVRNASVSVVKQLTDIA